MASTLSPPRKPWEVAKAGESFDSHSPYFSQNSATLPPLPAPPSFPLLLPPENPPGPSNWCGNASYGYNGSYYNSSGPYSSFNPNYYPTSSASSYPYGYPSQNSPARYLSSSLENTTRPIIESLNHVLQAVNHVSCFIDSTAFAMWSSVSAVGTVLATMKSIRSVYIKWIIDRLRVILGAIKNRRVNTAAILSIAAALPFVIRGLYKLVRISSQSLKEPSESSSALVPFASQNDDQITERHAFVKAIYPYQSTDAAHLSFNPGELILIDRKSLDKMASSVQPTSWIIGRLKDGSSGYFPSNYVNTI